MDGLELELEVREDEFIDWNDFFDEVPECANGLEFEPPSVVESCSWINEIENILMEDDDQNTNLISGEEDTFLADVIVDSDDLDGEKVHTVAADTADDDPNSKKRKRQLRNRDAAVRSRERKKVYVKDLEMKNRFLEGECRRLGRLLQCYYAENQSLRFTLLTKQESAVLLLESLLLGSLLWLVSIPRSTLDVVVPRVIVAEEGPGSAPLHVGMGRNKNLLLQTRRCKASRTRMKPVILVAPA